MRRYVMSFLLSGMLLVVPVRLTAQTQASAASPPQIRFKSVQFDPLAGEPKIALRLALSPTERQQARQIVQFRRPLTREETARLKESYGLALDQYVPDFAYLEKIQPAILEELRKLPYFRWTGPYQPAYKIDPEIGRRTFVTPRRRAEPGIVLMVTAFPEAQLDRLSGDVRRLGFGILGTTAEPRHGILRLRVRVSRPEDAEAIARLAEVKSIEELGDITLNNGTTTWVNQTNVNGSRTVWDHGLRGEGQIIGHIDGALDLGHCFYRDDTDNTPRPDHRKVVGVRNAAGGTIDQTHGTFTAGNAAAEDVGADALSATPNANNGNAPRTRLTHGYLYDLDWTGGSSSFFDYLVQAFADGAFIHTNSWDDKSTSAYTQISAELDRFVWENEDNLVLIGPDNYGTIRPPDTAKNALVVNATQQNPNQGSFSSGIRQFSLDGRRKPDLIAPGENIVSADDGTACGTMTASGTSAAAPGIAGTAALVRQYYTEGWYPSGTRQPHHAFTPSGALLKATLLNATVDAAGIIGYPDNAATGEGWGRLLLEDGLFFSGDVRNLAVWDVRNAGGLASGESHAYTVAVAGSGQPLKITLVWNEPPAAANSATPVINDLDLTVTRPDGTALLGNVFSGGQSNPGGAADTLNNVEQVLLTAPATGLYTVTVSGGTTGVNQGPQGYALVATGDFPEPPVPTGDQDTLVVRVGIPGVLGGAPPTVATATTLMTSLSSYVSEVSYGQATLDPIYTEVALTQPRSFYFHPSRNPLVEMAEEAIAALVAADPDPANPDVFDRGTADPADDIDRIILLLNDPSFAEDLATTGPWPYDLPAGLTRRLSVSIQSVFNDAPARSTHGILHHFGLVDLYAHPNIIFAQPHADGWDNMAFPFTGTGTLAWSKQRPGWITAQGSTIQYFPRPAAGASVNQPVDLSFLTSTGTDTKAVALGLTPGAASLDDEDVLYWIEARSNAAGTVDSLLSETGVLVYQVNENVPQGEGPVRLLDEVLGTASLDDAALETGDTLPTTSYGLSISVTAGSATGRTVQIGFDPPEDENDVRITVGDPVWTSPDIWVDSPRDGFDLELGRAPADRGDQPVTTADNRIYVRVTNPGPGPAFNVTVFVRVSEPYHTVGGQTDFNRFAGQIHYDVINAGETKLDFIEWRPDDDGDPHSCIEVEIPDVLNDLNANNNRAQQNVEEVASTTGSPYTPVTYPFGLTNPEATRETLVYFRAEGVPAGWTATLSPKSALLAPGERIDGTLTLKPPDGASVCTEHRIRVTSWTPRGDTLVPIGGGSVQVDLRNQTLLTLDTGSGPCTGETVFVVARTTAPHQRCATITASGCTDPPRPHETIVVRYNHPDGYPVFHQVQTDAMGCYSDSLVVVEGGSWEVTAEYPGSDCSGPATTPGVGEGVDLPTGVDADGDGLPPGQEPQGDHDRDGVLGLYDPDSDNDGVLDGKEPQGDCDRDGRANVVDPDSDNDVIPDGRDLTLCGGILAGGRWGTSVHVGSAHPLGDFDKTADANVYVQLDAGYRLTDRIDLKLLLGLAQLTAESATGIEHPRWLHGSLALDVLLPAGPGGLVPYLEAGAGIYRPKSGGSEPGFHLGLGARVPLPGPFKLQFGTDLHQVQADDPERFLTLHLGVLLP